MASAGPVGILGGPTGSRTLRANQRTINTMADHRTVKKDGRHARGERNRLAILEACLALIDEGWLAPTAQLISERAGITIRSLFRHFPDMESLFAAANNEVRSRAAGAFTTKVRGGSLEERIRATVERYCEGYSDQKNLFLMTKGLSWRYPILKDNYARLQKDLRDNLELLLPEISQLDTSQQELAHAITSFEMWHRLSEHQELSSLRTLNLLVDELYRLLLQHTSIKQ